MGKPQNFKKRYRCYYCEKYYDVKDVYVRKKGSRVGELIGCKKCWRERSRSFYHTLNGSRRAQYILKNSARIKNDKNGRSRGLRRLYIERKTIVMNHCGWKCACCGENNVGFLTIDHKNRDNSKKWLKIHKSGITYFNWIIKNNFPKFLRTFCYNCNYGRERYGGVCPHRLAKIGLVGSYKKW